MTGKAPYYPGCSVHSRLSMKSGGKGLFAPLAVPITASGLQG
jgi:hypothetical protein